VPVHVAEDRKGSTKVEVKPRARRLSRVDDWHVHGLSVGQVAGRMGSRAWPAAGMTTTDYCPASAPHEKSATLLCRRPLPRRHDPRRPTRRAVHRRDRDVLSKLSARGAPTPEDSDGSSATFTTSPATALQSGPPRCTSSPRDHTAIDTRQRAEHAPPPAASPRRSQGSAHRTARYARPHRPRERGPRAEPSEVDPCPRP
jgi:hypothetical protein